MLFANSTAMRGACEIWGPPVRCFIFQKLVVSISFVSVWQKWSSEHRGKVVWGFLVIGKETCFFPTTTSTTYYYYLLPLLATSSSNC